MTVQEKLQADLDAANSKLAVLKEVIAAAEAEVAAASNAVLTLPTEVAGIAHTEWDRIKAFFKALV